MFCDIYSVVQMPIYARVKVCQRPSSGALGPSGQSVRWSRCVESDDEVGSGPAVIQISPHGARTVLRGTPRNGQPARFRANVRCKTYLCRLYRFINH